MTRCYFRGNQRWFWVLLAVAVAGLLVVLILGRIRSSSQRVTLPDGTELELRAVTVGTNHQFRLHPGWAQFLRALPDLWVNKIAGGTAFESKTGQPTLCFWLVRRAPVSARLAQRPYLCDENGVGTYWTYRHVDSRIDPNTFVEHVLFDTFPRRSKRLTLRFYATRPSDPKSPAPVAEFTVRNPFRSPASTWEPETLPVTRREGDRSFKLLEVKAGVNQTNPLAPPPTPLYGHVYLHCQVEQNGQPADWIVSLVRFSDSGGNSVLVEGPTFRNYRSGNQGVVWDRFLFSDESAWRIDVQFLPYGPPRPDELHTLPAIPIADSAAQSRWIEWRPDASDTRIMVRARRRSRPDGSITEFEATVAPDQGDRLNLREVRDDTGGVYQPVDFLGNRTSYRWDLALHPDATELTATFQLRRGHWETFVVQPEFPFAAKLP